MASALPTPHECRDDQVGVICFLDDLIAAQVGTVSFTSPTSFETFAVLMAAAVPTANDTLAWISGWLTEGDAFGGRYRYDATSTTPADGFNVGIPDAIDPADPGRWLREVT